MLVGWLCCLYMYLFIPPANISMASLFSIGTKKNNILCLPHKCCVLFMLAMFSKFKWYRLLGPLEVSLLLLSVSLQRFVIIIICIQFVFYCAQTGSYCIQVVKQRMQTGQFKKAPDAVRLIVAKEGFKGLYAVCICCILINFPLLKKKVGNNFLRCNANFYFKSGWLLNFICCNLHHLTINHATSIITLGCFVSRVMVPFYFEIFHSTPFNSAYTSNFELVTNLWYSSIIVDTTIFLSSNYSWSCCMLVWTTCSLKIQGWAFIIAACCPWTNVGQ